MRKCNVQISHVFFFFLILLADDWRKHKIASYGEKIPPRWRPLVRRFLQDGVRWWEGSSKMASAGEGTMIRWRKIAAHCGTSVSVRMSLTWMNPGRAAHLSRSRLFNIFQHEILTLMSELQAVHVRTKRTQHFPLCFRSTSRGLARSSIGSISKRLVTELNTQHKICQNSWQQ